MSKFTYENYLETMKDSLPKVHEAKLTDEGQFIIASGTNEFTINQASSTPRRGLRAAAAPGSSTPSPT